MSKSTLAPVRALSFNNVQFNIVDRDGQVWLTASEISQALGYVSEKSISNLYARNASEFTSSMVEVIKVMTSGETGLNTGNLQKEVRIFSLRGAHLIGMFARTAIATQFRKWVLDVLERETAGGKVPVVPVAPVTPSRSLPDIEYKPGMLYTFMFDHYPIRAVYRDNTLWFSTHNIRRAFGYKHISRMLRGVAECDRRALMLYSGAQSPMISLEGLYYIGSKRYSVGRSVGALNSWISRVVLPQILKEGAPRKEDVQKLDTPPAPAPQVWPRNAPLIPIPVLPADAIGSVRVLTRIDLNSGQAISKLVPDSAYMIDPQNEGSVKSFLYEVGKDQYPTILEVIAHHYRDLKKVARLAK